MTYEDLSVPSLPPPPALSVSDRDALYAALVLADLAIDLAHHHGAPVCTVKRLRNAAEKLRTGK